MFVPHLELLATLAAPRGVGQYIRQHFLDTTFKGLYQINGFDLALLIPYFIVLIILASYGAHRYGSSIFITSTRRIRPRLRQLTSMNCRV